MGNHIIQIVALYSISSFSLRSIGMTLRSKPQKRGAMKTIGDLTFPAKPPKYWIADKESKGLSAAAWGRIYFRIYDDERRLIAWLAASEQEWADHGLIKP